jgi:hypothetical protein
MGFSLLVLTILNSFRAWYIWSSKSCLSPGTGSDCFVLFEDVCEKLNFLLVEATGQLLEIFNLLASLSGLAVRVVFTSEGGFFPLEFPKGARFPRGLLFSILFVSLFTLFNIAGGVFSVAEDIGCALLRCLALTLPLLSVWGQGHAGHSRKLAGCLPL